jgi:hypothetical protein
MNNGSTHPAALRHAEVWYFDTSAVNYLQKQLSVGDAIATKAFQEVRSREWRLSPVTIGEILLTKDVVKRESLIYFCQHLFFRELMPSPEEMLIAYIEAGCPLEETRYPLVSKLDVAVTWRALCDVKDKTFIYDQSQLERQRKGFAAVLKDFRQLVRYRGLNVPDNLDKSLRAANLQQLLLSLPPFKDSKDVSADDVEVNRVALYLLLVILVAGAALDPKPIDAFWQRRGIGKSTRDRIDYALANCWLLTIRGPLLATASMLVSQVKGPQRLSRGLYFDCMQCTYLPYVDTLFTTDKHFSALRAARVKVPMFRRIKLLDELQFVRHPSADVEQPHFLTRK